MARDLDLLLFGASGFVGALVAEHLARTAPEGLRVGLAGRSMERLAAVRERLPAPAANWPLVRADSADRASLDALALRTRVLASTVGPYARHGVPLVGACVSAGTHYADLTGEVLFVREIVDRWHAIAAAGGTRVVVSCGFDSVPSDLSVHLLRQRAAADGAGALTDTTLRVRRLSGGISGGTIESMRLQLEQLRGEPSLRRVAADPAALTGGAPVAPGQRDVAKPFLDGCTGEWNAPFFMAGYNTRLVRRSAALLEGPREPRLRYREVLPAGRGLGGRAAATAIALAGPALALGMSTPGLRRLLDLLLPSPGEGPSEVRRRSGGFEMETTTRTERGRRYTATVSATGDPGYAATAVMLGESALALAVDEARCSAGGGVLTPAVALGDVLVERLRRRGFRLDVRAG